MAFDLERAVRRVERITGVVIEIAAEEDGPYALTAADHELGGYAFSEPLGPRSKMEQQVKALHSQIYLARGKAKFAEQKGLCALCGRPMKGTEGTEIDHIVSRGAHGRNDHMSNLRVLDSACHQRRHGQKVRTA